jgi:hypothetical protein
MQQSSTVNYWLVASLAMVLLACGPSENESTAKPTRQDSSNNVDVALGAAMPTKQPATDNKSKQLKTMTAEQAKALLASQQHHGEHKKHLINGEMFSSASGLFIAGEMLFNIQLNQPARIKGSLVVVIDPSLVDQDKMASYGQVSELAKNTYRILFAAQQDLLTPYHQLTNTPGIQTVEMQIDYTPINSNEML